LSTPFLLRFDVYLHLTFAFALPLHRWHGIASYQIRSRFVNMFLAVFLWQFRASLAAPFLPL
jgi:hypothetical protein